MISSRRVPSAAIVSLILAISCAIAQDEGQAPATPAGLLVLSPSAFGGANAYQGWPLVVELTLWREAGATPLEPLTITAKQGTWVESLVVTVKNDDDAAMQWPLHLVPQEGAQLSLADQSASVEWWLSPEETQVLPEGSHTLTVAFDPEKVDGLPTAAAAPRSDPCHIRVAKEPDQLDADMAAAKLYRQAWYCMVKGDQAGADDAIGKMLAADPQSIGARRLKALLAAREGRVEEGLTLIDEAIGLYVKRHPNACPPAGLLSLREQLEAQLPQ